MKRLKLPLLLILRKWNILWILTVSMLPKYSELINRFLLLLPPIFILLFFVILDLHLLLDDIRENPWVPLINLLKLIHDKIFWMSMFLLRRLLDLKKILHRLLVISRQFSWISFSDMRSCRFISSLIISRNTLTDWRQILVSSSLAHWINF